MAVDGRSVALPARGAGGLEGVEALLHVHDTLLVELPAVGGVDADGDRAVARNSVHEGGLVPGGDLLEAADRRANRVGAEAAFAARRKCAERPRTQNGGGTAPRGHVEVSERGHCV